MLSGDNLIVVGTKDSMTVLWSYARMSDLSCFLFPFSHEQSCFLSDTLILFGMGVYYPKMVLNAKLLLSDAYCYVNSHDKSLKSKLMILITLMPLAKLCLRAMNGSSVAWKEYIVYTWLAHVARILCDICTYHI